MAFSLPLILIQALNGLAMAVTLFLVAAGLSLVFGVTRIVNFAHGSFFMLGAYLATSLVTRLPGGAGGFWLAVAGATLLAGIAGVVMERLLLRHLYRAPELLSLLGTFGVVLMLEDGVLALWGPEDRLGPRAPGLTGTVSLWGQPYPHYDLLLIAIGPLVLAGLWLLLHRTSWGIRVRAATADRDMALALGINPDRLFMGVLFVGAALAGLAGALQMPREAVTLRMDLAVVVEAFVVVVVGGLGSIGGAFLAAILIGEIHAFGILLLPQATLVLAFVVMAGVLALRPHGLLGHSGGEAAPPASAAPVAALAVSCSAAGGRTGARTGAQTGALILVVAGLLALLPLGVGDYTLTLVGETLTLGLFAASLHLLMGPGGMISFGHAAFFGLGAYGAALAGKASGALLLVGLPAAVGVAGVAALLVGWVCVRRSGVYLAMLTLAFAQVAWSLAVQWDSLTGGDNGLLGLWPGGWAASRALYYELVLSLCLLAWLGLRWGMGAPFGQRLRAGRDSPLRAEAVGIDVRWQQNLAFALAGAAAGLAGGLYALGKGSVFPTLLEVSRSVDALVMVLLGGIGHVLGPLLGAVVFHGLETQILRLTDYWRFGLGATIVALVLLCPQGLVGLRFPRRFS